MGLSIDDARERVIEAIESAVPGADARSLAGTSDVRDALDIDSFDVLQVAIALKALTGIEIPESEMSRLLTLDGAAAYLAARSDAR
jgi:acyl carrier protein